MLVNLGLTGQDVSDELLGKQGPFSEEFVEHDAADWSHCGRHLCVLPGEYAIANKEEYDAMGCCHLENSIAVIITCASNKAAIANVGKDGFSKVIGDMVIGIQGEGGKATRRGAPQLELFMVGGAHTEAIFSVLLTQFHESNFRFAVRLACVGPLNEGGYHGVSTHAGKTLINGVALDLNSREVRPLEYGSWFSNEPAIALRLARYIFNAAGNQPMVALQEASVVIPKFQFCQLDNQAMALLLWFSYNEPLKLWRTFYSGDSLIHEELLTQFSSECRKALLLISRHNESVFKGKDYFIVKRQSDGSWNDKDIRILDPICDTSHPLSLLTSFSSYVSLGKQIGKS